MSRVQPAISPSGLGVSVTCAAAPFPAAPHATCLEVAPLLADADGECAPSRGERCFLGSTSTADTVPTAPSWD